MGEGAAAVLAAHGGSAGFLSVCFWALEGPIFSVYLADPLGLRRSDFGLRKRQDARFSELRDCF